MSYCDVLCTHHQANGQARTITNGFISQKEFKKTKAHEENIEFTDMRCMIFFPFAFNSNDPLVTIAQYSGQDCQYEKFDYRMKIIVEKIVSGKIEYRWKIQKRFILKVLLRC